jgi:hypothetical protein
MKKPKLKLVTILLCVILICVIVGETKNNRQPVSYNHKLHTEEVGLTCQECHLNTETHKRAAIPNIEVCGDCHDDAEAENQQEAKVGDYVSRNTKIPWIQIHEVPDHAYFSHRRHVLLGKIECKSCHGEVEQLETPFVKPYVTLDMDWCMDCHEQRAVTNDCSTCHR